MCGNGMAMAIHSAKIASELGDPLSKWKKIKRVVGKVSAINGTIILKKRLKIGRLLSRILQKEKLAAAVMRILIVFPSLLPNHKKNTW
jgi:hypothetical protein